MRLKMVSLSIMLSLVSFFAGQSQTSAHPLDHLVYKAFDCPSPHSAVVRWVNVGNTLQLLVKVDPAGDEGGLVIPNLSGTSLKKLSFIVKFTGAGIKNAVFWFAVNSSGKSVGGDIINNDLSPIPNHPGYFSMTIPAQDFGSEFESIVVGYAGNKQGSASFYHVEYGGVLVAHDVHGVVSICP